MGASDLIPVSYTADAVFGGVSGLLGNAFVLAAIGIVVAIKVAPRIFHFVKRVAGSR